MRKMQIYNGLIDRHSYGYGENRTAGATWDEQQLLHATWLNFVVPKALRYAHRRMVHALQYERTQAMVVMDGHHSIVKLFSALLDQAMAEVLMNPSIRRLMNPYSDPFEIRANHYMEIFGRRAEQIQKFDLNVPAPPLPAPSTDMPEPTTDLPESTQDMPESTTDN